MEKKSANTILQDIRSLDPTTFTADDLKNLAKELSALRMNRVANVVQTVRNELAALEFSSLSVVDQGFILDDLRQLGIDVGTYITTNE